MQAMTTLRILGERPASRPAPHPAPIPAEAELYNGPRMLFGTFVDGMALAWLGEPIAASGAYYAAVLPGDPRAGQWRAHNRRAGAVRVEYVTARQAADALRSRYAAEGLGPGEINAMLDGADPAALDRQYAAAGLHLDCAA